jgi:hypothetical protein
MEKRIVMVLVAAGVSLSAHAEKALATSPESEAVVRVMTDSQVLEGVAFRDIVAAATGRAVFPVDQGRDQAWLEKLGRILDRVLNTLNDPSHAVQAGGRINEASRFIENELLKELGGAPGWKASIPATSSQTQQRSGYPDLRLQLEDGRIVYLDPKLHAAGSRASSFRTFYFEPRQETLKITEDAIHLLVAVQHSPGVEKGIQFDAWELIDIADMPLRLKAEFQASNQEIFQKSRIVGKSGPTPSDP